MSWIAIFRRVGLGFVAATAALWIAEPAAAQSSASPYTTGYRYDAAGRQTGVISPDAGTGTPSYLAVRNTYDSGGRLIKVEKGALSAWQSETVAPGSWSGFTIFQTLDTVYDTMNRKVLETLSASGTAFTQTQYSYDSAGRLECTAVRMNVAAFAPSMAQPTTAACSLETTGGDGPDRITHNSYDVVDELLNVQRAYGTSDQISYATYTYSDNGKQTSVTDANGNKASMGYDGFDRQSAWNFPSPTVPGTVSTTDYEAYSYDANGNRLTLKKRGGQVFWYCYDALNRMSSKLITDGTAPTRSCTSPPAAPAGNRNVYYEYDLQGLQLHARFDGTGGTDQVASGYDGFGRLTSSTTAMSGTSRTLAYQYDADGNRTRTTHPDTNFFTQEYDHLDRPTVTRENGGTSIASLTYNAEGLRLGLAFTAGAGLSYGYDGADRLNALSIDMAGTNNDASWGYGYSAASQITGESLTNDVYAANAAYNVSRTYAANGLNQYTQAGAPGLAYDADGNQTRMASHTFAFDAENKLISGDGGAQTLTYDPLGRLWQSTGSGGTTQFLYDGADMVSEYDGTGNLQHHYVHGSAADEPLVQYDGAGLATRRLLYADPHGSIVAISDAAGNLQTVNQYEDWGIPGVGNAGRFQYTGQMWLPEFQLYHYKARAYQPVLGRFLQTDPIGYGDQNNLYAYVDNNPISGADPTGNCPAWIYGCSGGGSGAYGGIDATDATLTDTGTGSLISIVTPTAQSVATASNESNGGNDNQPGGTNGNSGGTTSNSSGTDGDPPQNADSDLILADASISAKVKRVSCLIFAACSANVPQSEQPTRLQPGETSAYHHAVDAADQGEIPTQDAPPQRQRRSIDLMQSNKSWESAEARAKRIDPPLSPFQTLRRFATKPGAVLCGLLCASPAY